MDFKGHLCQILWLFLCLILTPMECIKIGISHNLNTSSTTTTTTTEATMTTSILDLNSTISSFPESMSTLLQTFPPRKTPKITTTAAPRQISTTPAAATVATGSKNVTTTNNVNYYCDCDLQTDLCEVNCCCDRDCTPEALRVFNCLQPAVAPQLQTRLEDFHYTHGLPSCKIHDGWLCVFRSNTKPPKMQPPSNNFDPDRYKKWPEQLGVFEEQELLPEKFTAHYKFGQTLQLWQPESKSLLNLELPLSFESSSCQLKQPLRHLKPLQSNCLMSDAAEMQQQLWTLLNLTSNHQLLGKPRDLEEQEVQGINIEICQQLLQQSEMICLEHFNETQLDIEVHKVELQLLHNYTNILAAKLLLREANLQQENEQLWLSYEVSFRTTTEEQMKPTSGPLGYVQGSSLLLAQLQPQNSSEKQSLLNYHSKNVTQQHEHWLHLCETNLVARTAVSFGVDLFKHCQLQQLAVIQPEHDNHTDYCKALQTQIWRQLLPNNCRQLEDLENIYISQLGKPQQDKWLPLQLNQPLLPIQGSFNLEQQSLSCRNMLLSVSYEFHVSELTLLEGQVPHQNVLQHARLKLGQRHDLEFDAAEQQIELPLSVSVMFFKTQQQQLNAANLHMICSGLLTITLLHYQ